MGFGAWRIYALGLSYPQSAPLRNEGKFRRLDYVREPLRISRRAPVAGIPSLLVFVFYTYNSLMSSSTTPVLRQTLPEGLQRLGTRKFRILVSHPSLRSMPLKNKVKCRRPDHGREPLRIPRRPQAAGISPALIKYTRQSLPASSWTCKLQRHIPGCTPLARGLACPSSPRSRPVRDEGKCWRPDHVSEP